MTTQIAKRVATYERVSSDDQRDRATIKTQRAALALRLRPLVWLDVVKRYVDDGVSGTIPIDRRPDGGRLLEDAAKGIFEELWVYRLDRLGREVLDSIGVKRRLNALGVNVESATETIASDFDFELRAVLAAEERRTFLARSQAGMDRAAKEGRYTGGVVCYGYKVEGYKATARILPSDRIVWGDWTEADVVNHIFQRSAIDGWSNPEISRELNDLGVPTHYTKDARGALKGKRKEKTRGKWRSGRILSMLRNATYRGEKQYGRRSTRQRDVVSAEVPAIVSEEVWHAAQETMTRNRFVARNAGRAYLLKSIIRCRLCGLNYSAAWDKRIQAPWYRCNGQMHERGIIEGKCQGKSIKGPVLENVVWNDIERFLYDPGDIIDELAREREMNPQAARDEADRMTLEGAMRQIVGERQNAIRLGIKGTITDDELDELLGEIAERGVDLTKRLKALTASVEDEPEPIDEDMLAQVRARINKGLSDEERQEIVRLLVKRITIHTEIDERGKKQATAVVEYRFSKTVVSDCTGMDSGRPRA